MTLTFRGVRGSIPAPGPDTVRYGGNTSCVTLSLDPGHTLVLDAGTGIRDLGNGQADHTYFVLLSHLHWDHIQGLPFFRAKNDPGSRIVFLGGIEPDWGHIALAQLDGLHFPVRSDDMAADIVMDNRAPTDVLGSFGASIGAIRVNHPGVCYGYRVDTGHGSFVFMPDNEIGAPERRHVTLEVLAEFCRGADLLIHDAQYTENEIGDRRLWGHSTVSQACDLAAAAAVGRLVLFHHDPDRSDAAVDDLVETARGRLRSSAVDVIAAAEGLSIRI